MLNISRSLSVDTLILLVGLGLISAQVKAERPLNTSQKRLDIRQNQELKQLSSREPAALHTGPNSSDRPVRPSQPSLSAPAENASAPSNQTQTFPSRPSRQPSVLEPIFSGRIEKWVGNFTPRRGKFSSTAQKLPLKTKLHIYKGKIKSNGNPFLTPLANGPKVFSVVTSDEKGLFKVQLPPGEYTVLFETEDGKLYLNSFDGDGNFSTIKMIDGQTTSETLIDTREAVF